MRGKRYPEEFKIEAVKQVIDSGYKVMHSEIQRVKNCAVSFK